MPVTIQKTSLLGVGYKETMSMTTPGGFSPKPSATNLHNPKAVEMVVLAVHLGKLDH